MTSITLSRLPILGIAATALLLAPDGTGAQGGMEADWTVQADTGIGGTPPALVVTVERGGVLPHATVVDIEHGDGSRPVAPRYTGGGEFRFEFPPVDKPSYLAMTLTDAAGEGGEVLEWRVLRLPEGERLLDYDGREDLYPPEDFDEFWATAREELSAVPMEPRVELQEGHETETGQLLRVELPTVRDTTIVCWFMVPKEAVPAVLNGEAPTRQYPAVIIMPGYGAQQPPLDRTADGFVTLSVNPRNHGPSRDFWTAPVEHLRYNTESPEDFYYRLAFLDCLRAAEFLFDQPIVDGDRVVAEGGSQGGLFAIALGVLEPRIAVVVSNVTAFSNYPDGMLLGSVGHQAGYRAMLEEADEESAKAIRRSLALTDGANLATRLTQPLQVNMGGLDPVCPYVSGIVIVNRAPEDLPTEYNVLPNARHEVPGEMRRMNAEWVARWLGLEEVPSFPGAVLPSPWGP